MAEMNQGSARTHLDEIVIYPNKVIDMLSKNQTLVSLLTNIPNADLDDIETENEWQRCTNDFNYVEGIVQDTHSFLCVDTEIRTDSNEIKSIILTLLVGVHREAMSLRNTAFIGMLGNRRDNIVREIDYTLRNSREFGIGPLQLKGWIKPCAISSRDHVCKLMEYQVANFAKSRDIRRE